MSELKRDENWRWIVNFVKEIVNLKQNVLQLEAGPDQLTIEELHEIVNFMVTN